LANSAATAICTQSRAERGIFARYAKHDGRGTPVTLTFGAPQGTDVLPIRRDNLTRTGQPLNQDAVANYIAKYATKTLTIPGLPDQRIRHMVDIEHLRCSAHYRRMITTAWKLDSRSQTGEGRFRHWAHARLRRPLPDQIPPLLRHLWPAPPRPHRPPLRRSPPWRRTRPLGRSLDETVVLILSTWTYAGTGYTAVADGGLALASAARAREHR
jgi:hypothetical protein